MRELDTLAFEEVNRLRKAASSCEGNAVIDEFLTNLKSIQNNSVLQKLDTECLTCRAQIQQDAVSINSHGHSHSIVT